ncbi:ATP-binding protein [Methanobrevibacter olleyae]|uniref:CO dehydrogenase maturation factor n=1 Tax=Methanobrevibacter olleyae TaxID=294671 RepID=A0A126R027_METOL|nr:P-loop NTPase [Methanobrevibacter olleyae]AMK15651.1 CobQ/CobB/MinD/ParA nucleotide binding domain-containing protein [Methanobrevibacter olleyae]SFL23880.1 CO dehydrogenase maturation factor [Methanobrevibacter olleyae]
MPKVLISGRGGSGKSTVVSLLAQRLKRNGNKILVVDSDESNLCLNKILGINKSKDTLMGNLGGKKLIRDKLMEVVQKGESNLNIFDEMSLDNLSEEYVSWNDNLGFLEIGKIEHSMEGCACPMGALARDFFNHIKVNKDEWILIDTEAGIEHFGRGLIEGVDFIVTIVDPSEDAILLANKAFDLSLEDNKTFGLILNKVDRASEKIIKNKLNPNISIIGTIDYSPDIAMLNLKGDSIDSILVNGLNDVINYIN